MPTPAKNDAELVGELLPALKQAAEYAAEEILKLNEQKIKTWVYNKYKPVVYQRTGGFERAWNTHGASMKTQGATGEVKASMDYEPKNTDKHPSIVDGHDVSDILADIIYQGLAGHIFGDGAWTQARDAFAQLDKTLGKQYSLAKYIENGMRKAGLKFKINDRNFKKTVT